MIIDSLEFIWSQCAQVLLISSVLCSLNYALTAILGYLLYGDDVQAQVTLNLPTGKMYTKVAILTTVINPLAKYALVVQPIAEAIEAKLPFAERRLPSDQGAHQHRRARQHGGGCVHCALLRVPHVLHRILTQCRRRRPIPVPELP